VYFCQNQNCKTILDRDYNAALNLQNEGISILKEGYESENNNNNTVATTGINACGLVSIETRLKQEKRGFQQSVMAVV